MKQKFDKKIFTAGIFFKDIYFLIYSIPTIVGALRNKKISKTFIEKIMMVTTGVNGCIYCEWFHAKQAVACGISEEEIRNMLNLQFHADASDFELTALLYAQHYAETNRKPDADMTARFFDFYGEKTAMHLFMFIRMIYFGNLFGNTWDAVISRLKGNPAKNSNLLFELFFFLLTFWFMGPAMIPVKKS
ncbi:carboxymuconolactone decarboxylase family protein [candidate division KSB1 bacterium]|nr:carboxymuconolactone decarboxylase family protein [candidate division KSB1 bacterium]